MQAESTSQLLGQIQSLSDLHSQLQSLRHIPRILLKLPAFSSLVPPSTPTLRSQFQQLNEIAQILRSHPVQHALRSAQGSFVNDPSELAPNPRGDDRKRRRVHAPESPQPYFPQEQRRSPVFPPDSATHEPINADTLIDYIRDFNEKHQAKLHIWAHVPRQDALDPPVTLRFSIPDVLLAFLSLNYGQVDRSVIVETISIFGPREKKAPHAQSDFMVYKCLTQQIGKVLQLRTQLPLQCIVELLGSYSGLFIERCTVCERVLSAEGHIPPVVRIWTADDKDGSGKWEPRHITCRQG